MRYCLNALLLAVYTLSLHGVEPHRASNTDALSALSRSMNYVVDVASNVPGVRKSAMEPWDGTRRRAAFEAIRESAKLSPMRYTIGALIGQDYTGVAFDAHGPDWSSLVKKLGDVPTATLEGVVAQSVSDLDLHGGAEPKLIHVFGTARAHSILEAAGRRANERLAEVEAILKITETVKQGWFGKMWNGTPAAGGKRRDFGRRSTVRPLIVQTSARVDAILKELSRAAAKLRTSWFINLENELVLRFAIGPRTTTELLLAYAPSILVKNMSPAERLVTPIEDYLLDTMRKVRGLAAQLQSDSADLMQIPLFRPGYSGHLKFLVGESRTEQLMNQFPTRYTNYLLRNDDLLHAGNFRPADYKRELLRLLKRNVKSHEKEFWIISVFNKDRLEALFGPIETYRLLSERGCMVLDRLGHLGGCMEETIRRDETLVFRELNAMLPPNLGKYSRLFTPDREMELAFLIGPERAEVMAQRGIRAAHEVAFNRPNRAPQKCTLLQLFFPTESFLGPMERIAFHLETTGVRDEVQSIIRV